MGVDEENLKEKSKKLTDLAKFEIKGVIEKSKYVRKKRFW
jgi:hypothetical protein